MKSERKRETVRERKVPSNLEVSRGKGCAIEGKLVSLFLFVPKVPSLSFSLLLSLSLSLSLSRAHNCIPSPSHCLLLIILITKIVLKQKPLLYVHPLLTIHHQLGRKEAMSF